MAESLVKMKAINSNIAKSALYKMLRVGGNFKQLYLPNILKCKF